MQPDAGSAGSPAQLNAARVGVGYDSHRFAPGIPLVLGGVTIDSDIGLSGHSDGDAIAHALTDAILGAAAAGDIGEMFPDTAAVNKGRSSIEMLKLAVQAVEKKGWAVSNADITVITEHPRIAPFRAEMRAVLSDALGISLDTVSIKGKSNEGMGWIGSREGLACIACATLVPRK